MTVGCGVDDIVFVSLFGYGICIIEASEMSYMFFFLFFPQNVLRFVQFMNEKDTLWLFRIELVV